MTIKIDGNRPVHDADAARRLEAVRTNDRLSANRVAAPADRLEVSRDVKLMTSALKAAGDPSEIRRDVVDRMRRLIDTGELGSDSGKLADSLIDHMLNKT